MKNKVRFVLILLFLLSAVTCSLSVVEAAVPHLINYQGKLTDSGGVSLTGSYNITFRIYNAETAGTLLWQETQTGVVVQKGVFSILLGSVTALNLPFDTQYYLAIQVGADSEMSPRQRITSAGYAIRAEESEKLGGKQSSEYALATDITVTPTANKVVKLDANAKLPSLALKVYDSGWFAVSNNTSYTKNHYLGTTKIVCSLYGATNATGSNQTTLGDVREYGLNFYGVCVTNIQNNSVDIRVAINDTAPQTRIWNGSSWVYPTYVRIVILALE